ncbi:MAG: NAD kinase [Weeksellaceae bacterium]|nr:NAD kinase [Weeksellaceae bacterium]
MKIALYGMQDSESLGLVFPDFYAFARKHDLRMQVAESWLPVLKKLGYSASDFDGVYSSQSELWDDLDLFLTFGGDGTILSASTIVKDSGVPILGVNTGRLGYLASVSWSEFRDCFDSILEKKYRVVPRSVLQVVRPGMADEPRFALNEVTVMRRETTSMITVETYINDVFLNAFWADGLIISTPTGSTGYSLSCNGPIIAPDNPVLVITPVAPHNLNVRPLVLNDDVKIRLKVHTRSPQFLLTMDSRFEKVQCSEEIFVEKAPFEIKIAQLENTNYLETLRLKLMWGLDKRNP